MGSPPVWQRPTRRNRPDLLLARCTNLAYRDILALGIHSFVAALLRVAAYAYVRNRRTGACIDDCAETHQKLVPASLQ